MSKVDELEQFETWTKDILLGIGADEDTVSLAHVGKMVRMIYDKGRAEGAEQERERIRDNSLHYRQFDKMEPNIVAGEHNDYAFAQENLFVVLASVLAPEVKP